MNWVRQLNAAINYIEENLTSEIDYMTAAKIASCSVFTFSRMFTYLADMPLSEYIRRRRLTQAVHDLQNSETSIIDLAYRYGYNSPDSFTRAFQKFHGVVPSLARQKGVTLTAFSRISFHISIKGESEMRYTIVDKGPFDVFGIEQIFPTVSTDLSARVPAFWQDCHQNGSYDKLEDAVGGNVPGESRKGICPINAVLNYRKTGDLTFPYMICGFVNETSKTEGYTRVSIPAMTWVVFTSEEITGDQMPEQVGMLFERAYSDWLPNSEYKKVDGPEFEIYGEAGNGLYFVEVWLPVTMEKMNN